MSSSPTPTATTTNPFETVIGPSIHGIDSAMIFMNVICFICCYQSLACKSMLCTISLINSLYNVSIVEPLIYNSFWGVKMRLDNRRVTIIGINGVVRVGVCWIIENADSRRLDNKGSTVHNYSFIHMSQ